MHEIADEHLLQSILQGNTDQAKHNQEHFEEDGTFVVNLMSAPGAGKTSLLAFTIPQLSPSTAVVIEGDMVGEADAEKLRQKGISAHQISTGRSCHLDARMVANLLHSGDLPAAAICFIENVGNLVCPAEFPLGEHRRVVLLSVTEGDDKPLKYPVIFRNCDAVVFTKVDLLPYVDFSMAAATANVRGINPDVQIFALSVTDHSGTNAWLQWLQDERAQFSRLSTSGRTKTGR